MASSLQYMNRLAVAAKSARNTQDIYSIRAHLSNEFGYTVLGNGAYGCVVENPYNKDTVFKVCNNLTDGWIAYAMHCLEYSHQSPHLMRVFAMKNAGSIVIAEIERLAPGYEFGNPTWEGKKRASDLVDAGHISDGPWLHCLLNHLGNFTDMHAGNYMHRPGDRSTKVLTDPYTSTNVNVPKLLERYTAAGGRVDITVRQVDKPVEHKLMTIMYDKVVKWDAEIVAKLDAAMLKEPKVVGWKVPSIVDNFNAEVKPNFIQALHPWQQEALKFLDKGHKKELENLGLVAPSEKSTLRPKTKSRVLWYGQKLYSLARCNRLPSMVLPVRSATAAKVPAAWHADTGRARADQIVHADFAAIEARVLAHGFERGIDKAKRDGMVVGRRADRIVMDSLLNPVVRKLEPGCHPDFPVFNYNAFHTPFVGPLIRFPSKVCGQAPEA